VKRVLVVEDEFIIAEVNKNIIQELGHEVVGVAYNGNDSVELSCLLRPDVVFMDISMEGRTDGIDACKKIKDRCPEIKIYFVTAYVEEVYTKELENIKYDGYIDKIDFGNVIAGLLK